VVVHSLLRVTHQPRGMLTTLSRSLGFKPRVNKRIILLRIFLLEFTDNQYHKGVIDMSLEESFLILSKLNSLILSQRIFLNSRSSFDQENASRVLS
jgi:hypothetical protein